MLILQAPIKGKMRSLFFTLILHSAAMQWHKFNVKKKSVITFAPQKPPFLAVSADCRPRQHRCMRMLQVGEGIISIFAITFV